MGTCKRMLSCLVSVQVDDLECAIKPNFRESNMFQGSIVALVTPMQVDGSVDESSLRALVDWHVEQGTDAIVAVGTSGESATLDELRVAEAAANYAREVDPNAPGPFRAQAALALAHGLARGRV